MSTPYTITKVLFGLSVCRHFQTRPLMWAILWPTWHSLCQSHSLSLHFLFCLPFHSFFFPFFLVSSFTTFLSFLCLVSFIFILLFAFFHFYFYLFFSCFVFWSFALLKRFLLLKSTSCLCKKCQLQEAIRLFISWQLCLKGRQRTNKMVKTEVRFLYLLLFIERRVGRVMENVF